MGGAQSKDPAPSKRRILPQTVPTRRVVHSLNENRYFNGSASRDSD